MKKLEDAAKRLERAQMAVADAAKQVAENATRSESKGGNFIVPMEEMLELIRAEREWSAATEALLSLQTAGRDLKKYEVIYLMHYDGVREVTAESDAAAEDIVARWLKDDPAEAVQSAEMVLAEVHEVIEQKPKRCKKHKLASGNLDPSKCPDCRKANEEPRRG